MDRQVRLFTSAHMHVGCSKGGQVAAVIGCKVGDCHNLLMVEFAQLKVFVLVLTVAPVYTARFLSLLRVPAS